MAKALIGKVAALWRYPVKSMLGETIAETSVSLGGVVGDRAWALREVASARVLTAKKYPKLFAMSAAYEGSPDLGESAPLRITLPDGATIRASDPDASGKLSAALGFEVLLVRPHQGQMELAGIDPATVFGEVGIENIYPGLTAATAPDFVPLPEGAFFDSAVIHVLASGTLEHLRRLAGGKSRFDPRRFRPNIYVETAGDGGGFVEDQWLAGTLEVGGAVKITAMRPAMRCVMTTHPQQELERDPAVLRLAAKDHKACVGVYGAIGAPGTIRVGDPVFLVIGS